MNLSEARDLIREFMGERKLAAPSSAPSLTTFTPGGVPFWPIGDYEGAVHFIYEEGISDRGPVDTLSIGVPNVRPQFDSIPTGGANSGVIGRLLVITKAGPTDTFFRVTAIMDDETTFQIDDDDDDLDQPVLNYRNKLPDAELNFLIDYYNKQVQSRTHAIRGNSSGDYQATATLNFADADPDTITRDSGSWLTDGFLVGQTITVANANTSANNGTYTIDSLTATVITLVSGDTLTADASDSTATITGDFTFVTDQRAYDIPSNALLLNEESEVWHDGDNVVFTPTSELLRIDPDFKDNSTDKIIGRPRRWFQDSDKSKIKFYPIPDSTVNAQLFLMEYVKKLDDLSADTDNLLDNDFIDFHMTVIHGVLMDLYKKRRQFQESGFEKGEYEDGINKLQAEVHRRELTPRFFPMKVMAGRSKKLDFRFGGKWWDRI